MILVLRGGGRDLLQIVLAQCPGAPALHLLEIIFAADIPHENQALNGLHVRTRGDHIHSDGNSGIVAVAEFAQGFLGILGGIGDLFAEIIALAKFLPDDLDNIVGVTVALGKNQGLGHFPPPGKQGCIQVVPECPDHRADLAGIYNIPVKLGGAVVHVLVQLRPALLPGHAVAVLHHLLQNRAALPADLSLNQENILTDVDAIDDGLLPGILTDNVLVKVCQRPLVRGGGQANLESVEVFQNLLPHVIDGAVALVNNDNIKEFRRIFGVVYHFLGRLPVNRRIFV